MAHCTYLFAVFLLSLYSVNGLIPAEWLQAVSSDPGFSWENCGSNSDPIRLKTLQINPDPIKVPGKVTVNLIVSIASTLPTDMRTSITLEKKVGNFYINVPCEDSCNYVNLCENWAKFCSKYLEKYGVPCQCPIRANTYSIPYAIIDVPNKLPSQAEGEFKLTIHIAGSSGHLGCVKVQFKLKD